MPRRRIQRHDLDILRRSLTAGPLPAAEVQWLLDETARLLVEREQVAEAVGRLSGPWHDARVALNEISRLTRPPPST